MKCRYLKLINHLKICTHRKNLDFRSRNKSGRPRLFPKRCNGEYCPLNDEMTDEIIKNIMRGY